MASRFYALAVDCHDVAGLARFWAAVLDWKITYEAPDEVVVQADEDVQPEMIFLPVPEDKAAKNRLHIDLAPDDQEAEVKRLVDLGATRVDVGQRDVTWVVLADPEGNEFCVLSAR